jgi:hypothetical protein
VRELDIASGCTRVLAQWTLPNEWRDVAIYRRTLVACRRDDDSICVYRLLAAGVLQPLRELTPIDRSPQPTTTTTAAPVLDRSVFVDKNTVTVLRSGAALVLCRLTLRLLAWVRLESSSIALDRVSRVSSHVVGDTLVWHICFQGAGSLFLLLWSVGVAAPATMRTVPHRTGPTGEGEWAIVPASHFATLTRISACANSVGRWLPMPEGCMMGISSRHGRVRLFGLTSRQVLASFDVIAFAKEGKFSPLAVCEGGSVLVVQDVNQVSFLYLHNPQQRWIGLQIASICCGDVRETYRNVLVSWSSKSSVLHFYDFSDVCDDDTHSEAMRYALCLPIVAMDALLEAIAEFFTLTHSTLRHTKTVHVLRSLEQLRRDLSVDCANMESFSHSTLVSKRSSWRETDWREILPWGVAHPLPGSYLHLLRVDTRDAIARAGARMAELEDLQAREITDMVRTACERFPISRVEFVGCLDCIRDPCVPGDVSRRLESVELALRICWVESKMCVTARRIGRLGVVLARRGCIPGHLSKAFPTIDFEYQMRNKKRKCEVTAEPKRTKGAKREGESETVPVKVKWVRIKVKPPPPPSLSSFHSQSSSSSCSLPPCWVFFPLLSFVFFSLSLSLSLYLSLSPLPLVCGLSACLLNPPSAEDCQVVVDLSQEG